MTTQETRSAELVNPLTLSRVLPLARGQLMTLSRLHNRDGGWGDQAVGETLSIQRFIRAATAWIKDVERWQAAQQVQTAKVADDTGKDALHRSDCFSG